MRAHQPPRATPAPEQTQRTRVFPAALRPRYGQVRMWHERAHYWIRYGPDFAGRYTLVDRTGEAFRAMFTDAGGRPC